jgi:hypothetical protein
VRWLDLGGAVLLWAGDWSEAHGIIDRMPKSKIAHMCYSVKVRGILPRKLVNRTDINQTGT